MNPEQHILFPENGSDYGNGNSNGNGNTLRNCDQCGKPYPFSRKTSRFCSGTCRGLAHVKNNSIMKPPSPPIEEEKPEKKSTIIPSPSLNTNKLSTDAAIAIELLKEAKKELQQQLNDERKENKKLKAQLENQILSSKEKEYNARLQGLEERKPDLLDRISNLPPQVLEAFTPILGRLGNLLIPEMATTPMAGVQGQLDESTSQFLAWVDQLPDDEKIDLFDLLGALTIQDPSTRKTSLKKVKNVLINGTTIQAPAYNPAMYGN